MPDQHAQAVLHVALQLPVVDHRVIPREVICHPGPLEEPTGLDLTQQQELRPLVVVQGVTVELAGLGVDLPLEEVQVLRVVRLGDLQLEVLYHFKLLTEYARI
jgi:hypothetical protein